MKTQVSNQSQTAVLGDSFFLRRRRELQIAFVILLALWAGWNWFETFDSVRRAYYPFPHWDYWRAITDFEALRAHHFGVLWRQHNDHRILFPEIVYQLDLFGLRGLNLLPLVLSCLCYFGAWLTIAATVWWDSRLPSSSRLLIGLLSGVLMGWPGSSAVLGMPFLLQWSLLQIAALLALAWIARVKPNATGWRLAGSISAAIVATYTAANGLLVWPLLFGAAFVLRLCRRQFAVLSASAALSIGLYFFRYESSRPDLATLFRHPVYTLGFLATYLSAPFGYKGHRQVAIVFGLLGMAAFAWVCIAAVRNRLVAAAPGIVFLVGTAMRFPFKSSGSMGRAAMIIGPYPSPMLDPLAIRTYLSAT